MKIKTVKLKNFRNFNDFYAEFSDDINIFIGKNGQGKTNIIESFYVLSVCRSFRTHITQQLIKFDEDFSKINASITANNHDLNLEMIDIVYKNINRTKKRLLISLFFVIPYI